MSELIENNPILKVCDLSVSFVKDSQSIQVTDCVSFDIFPGEFFALVGESGSGKSVTAMGILRLLPYPSAKIVNGSILFDLKSNNEYLDLVKLPLSNLQKIRGSEIACIFQEPMQALNPVIIIKKQLLEVFKFCSFNNPDLLKNNPMNVICEHLEYAGFKDVNRVLNSYPHELSGGMLQRICIVMAILSKPKLIIADEPTTALDVTVQAQVLNVLKEMSKKTNTSVLLITHNMGIVSNYANRVSVMYAGRIVESGNAKDVIFNPKHPYTQGLLAAIPESHGDIKNLHSIKGSVPNPKDFSKGCRFAERCERCQFLDKDIQDKCKSNEVPTRIFISKNSSNMNSHYVSCFGVNEPRN